MRIYFGSRIAALLAAIVLVGCSNSTQAPAGPAVAHVPDVDVTEHVKTALHLNRTLSSSNIGVVTVKGDVQLTGVLDSQAQIDEAVRIARASDGAHTIHDELTLRK